MSQSMCDMVCEVLKKTNDGNDLAPIDLKLIEMTINGFINELGEVAFYELHARVLKGEYQKPWLQGVEHLTMDHEGFVYWKDQSIEHWDGKITHEGNARGQAEAAELSRRCNILEKAGEPINTNTVIWNWPDK